jgi:hypothetical protein
MRLALPAALLLCACGLRAPRTTAAPCAATSQCDRSDVCFLGQCRGPSAQLSLVSAEVHPPNNSQFGVMQQANIDLHQLPVLHDFALQPPFGVAGQVRQLQNDGTTLITVADAALTFIDHAPAIPDRVDKVSAKSDANGQFSAHLPAASWDLLLEPPSPLPPSRGSSPLNTAAAALDLRLPAPVSLVQVNGSVSAGGTLLTGARIAAVDSAGLAISAPATTADGGFSLLLPPGTTTYSLEIGPPNEMDGGVTNSDPLPEYEVPPGTPAVNLLLPTVATLTGRVLDSTGAGIASARVYARSTGTTQWSLSRSTSTAADGSYSLPLRAGSYLVEAAPSGTPDAPGVSAEKAVVITAPGLSLDISCPAKAHAFGLLKKPDGTPAGSGYQITATRLADDLLTARTAFSTVSDAAGIYHLIGDYGRYRLEVQPPVATGLPRKIVEMDLIASPVEYALPDIQISPPLEVVGTVHGTPPGGVDGPIAGASVDFYALDATGLHAVYIGSGLTDAQGRYKAVLPYVSQPGTVP